jgi:hypothetical protein
MQLVVPTTVYTDKRFPGFFHKVHSPNAIPTTIPQLHNTTVWDLPPTHHAFVDTPEFYQRILGGTATIVSVKIATGIELEILVTCSDGSFDPVTRTGSHGWVVLDTSKEILVQGSGLADGHPTSMSSYRAELGFTIYRICQFQQVTSGKLKHHCDNKSVLANVFNNKPTTTTQFLHANYD